MGTPEPERNGTHVSQRRSTPGHLSESTDHIVLCLTPIRTHNGRFSGLWDRNCRQSCPRVCTEKKYEVPTLAARRFVSTVPSALVSAAGAEVLSRKQRLDAKKCKKFGNKGAHFPIYGDTTPPFAQVEPLVFRGLPRGTPQISKLLANFGIQTSFS